MLKKLLLLLCFISLSVAAQQKMTGTFSPAEDYKWFIIYKLKTTHQEYVDNGKIVDGKLLYTFKEDAPTGMYRLVYGMPQESENFDFIYNGKEAIVFKFDENGSEFTESKENILHTSYFKTINEAKQLINSYYQSGNTDASVFEGIFGSIDQIQQEFEKEAEETIVYNFIKANRTYIPSSYETPETMVNNIRKHYFDAIDFSNTYLQNSDFISEKVSAYVFTALPLKDFTDAELEEAYKENISVISKKIASVPLEYQETILSVLWEQMVVLENERIAIHIADRYLLPIAKKLNDEELITKLETHKRLAIGVTAPEITWVKDRKTHKLSELNDAENYIVVFWSSTCSHCLEEFPKLKTFIEKQEKGKYKVIAVGLEDERESWANETVFYPDFIHILGLGKWDNDIGNTYDVTATPTFFILDKDKRIIGKPYGVKELEAFFN